VLISVFEKLIIPRLDVLLPFLLRYCHFTKTVILRFAIELAIVKKSIDLHLVYQFENATRSNFFIVHLLMVFNKLRNRNVLTVIMT
jgi:hypothetical protein